VEEIYAEWSERLTTNTKVATVLGFDPSILRNSGISGAADEALVKKVHKNFNKNFVNFLTRVAFAQTFSNFICCGWPCNAHK
jgi:hypothetical protein